MAKRKKKRLNWRAVGVVLFILVVAGLALFDQALKPVDPHAKATYLKLTHPEKTDDILHRLADQGLLRSYPAARVLASLRGVVTEIPAGTYRVGANFSTMQIIRALVNPIHQMLRLPANYWAARTAKLLEKNNVCPADEYLAAVSHPEQFTDDAAFPMPKGSLEGYLMPDVYDLPPETPANQVVTLQLKAFEEKVWVLLDRPNNLKEILTKASLVELEVANDEDRRKVASVIDNRLKKHMPLQIDASLNYGLGVWRPLKLRDYKEVPGPYNLYRHPGLPPGPICSPSVNSIQAVLHPDHTNYLYYVSLPGGVTLYAATWPEHLANVAKRKAMLAERAKGKP